MVLELSAIKENQSIVTATNNPATSPVTGTTNSSVFAKPVGQDKIGDNVELQSQDELFDSEYATLTGFDKFNNVNQKDLINELKKMYPQELYKYTNTSDKSILIIERKTDGKKIYVINDSANTIRIKCGTDNALEFNYDENGKVTSSLEYDKNDVPIWMQTFHQNGQIATYDEYNKDNPYEVLHSVSMDENGKKTYEKSSNNDAANTFTNTWYNEDGSIQEEIRDAKDNILSAKIIKDGKETNFQYKKLDGGNFIVDCIKDGKLFSTGLYDSKTNNLVHLKYNEAALSDAQENTDNEAVESTKKKAPEIDITKQVAPDTSALTSAPVVQKDEKIDEVDEADKVDEPVKNEVKQERWKNGNLKKETEIGSNGQILSVKNFYRNGNLKDENHYSEDGKIISSTTYFSNGNMEKHTEFYEDGKASLIQTFYKNGNLDKETAYDEQGKKISYKNHNKNGVIRRDNFVNESGQTVKRKCFRNGQVNKERIYNEEGKLIAKKSGYKTKKTKGDEESSVKDIKEYHDNGKMKVHEQYRRDGSMKSSLSQYENGYKQQKVTYDKEGNEKTRKDYLPKGQRPNFFQRMWNFLRLN